MSLFYRKSGLLHETKEVGKVRGLFLQRGENSQPYPLLDRGRLFTDPLAVVEKTALAVLARILDNRQFMFDAHAVREPPQGKGRTNEIMKFPGAVKGRRIEINVIVDMGLVCTHTDKAHIHNHIYFNATAFDRSRKFHNFIGSSFALRRLSDRVCIEHELSVIQNPRQHSKGCFLHYGQWIGEKPPSAKQRVRLAILAALEKKPTDFADFLRLMEESGFVVKQGRGGVISFLAPGQEKPTRLRASTLGVGFALEDIKAVIAGERPLPELPEELTVPPRRVDLIIDIQERMAQGKGPAYERWAKVYNLKQMAAALQYLQEHHLTDYAALTASTEAAVDHFHKLSDELRTTEEALSKTSELMAATVDYAKTRPVFDGYKAARYSKKYLAQHEAELATYRAAKDTMNTILNGAKLPKIEALKKSRRELAGQKKELYAEYREAQRQMREAVAVKANIDHLLGVTDERENKAQER